MGWGGQKNPKVQALPFRCPETAGCPWPRTESCAWFSGSANRRKTEPTSRFAKARVEMLASSQVQVGLWVQGLRGVAPGRGRVPGLLLTASGRGHRREHRLYDVALQKGVSTHRGLPHLAIKCHQPIRTGERIYVEQ